MTLFAPHATVGCLGKNRAFEALRVCVVTSSHCAFDLAAREDVVSEYAFLRIPAIAFHTYLHAFDVGIFAPTPLLRS